MSSSVLPDPERRLDILAELVCFGLHDETFEVFKSLICSSALSLLYLLLSFLFL